MAGGLFTLRGSSTYVLSNPPHTSNVRAESSEALSSLKHGAWSLSSRHKENTIMFYSRVSLSPHSFTLKRTLH